jgi:hypothetical protein
MVTMRDTRNEYRILVRHFTGKIYVKERTNVRIELHWIFGDRLLGIGGDRGKMESRSCPMSNFSNLQVL